MVAIGQRDHRKLVVGCTGFWVNNICKVIVANCRSPVPLFTWNKLCLSITGQIAQANQSSMAGLEYSASQLWIRPDRSFHCEAYGWERVSRQVQKSEQISAYYFQSWTSSQPAPTRGYRHNATTNVECILCRTFDSIL